jgi:hypothetical protein
MSMHEYRNCDILHAIPIPNLAKQNNDFFAKKTEFTETQARRLDLTGLPVHINHDEKLGQVGKVIAYAVRDGAEEVAARAEILIALTSAGDCRTPADRDRLDFQRNALLLGAHRDVSLTHEYRVIGAHSAAARATDSDADCVIRKTAIEVSTCSEGRRDGSQIIAYLPSESTLRTATERCVRSFCAANGYATPPDSASPHHDAAEWQRHIDQVVNQVQQRRNELFAKEVRGYYRASASGTGGVTETMSPWQFVEGAAGEIDDAVLLNFAKIFDDLLPKPAAEPTVAVAQAPRSQSPAPAQVSPSEQ